MTTPSRQDELQCSSAYTLGTHVIPRLRGCLQSFPWRVLETQGSLVKHQMFVAVVDLRTNPSSDSSRNNSLLGLLPGLISSMKQTRKKPSCLCSQ